MDRVSEHPPACQEPDGSKGRAEQPRSCLPVVPSVAPLRPVVRECGCLRELRIVPDICAVPLTL